MTDLAYAVVMLFVVIAVHEAGHLGAAMMLGLPVSSIEVGEGPEVFSQCHRGVWLRVRLVPCSGQVRLCWPSRKAWKNIAVAAAGPAANLVMAAALWWLAPILAVTSLCMGAFNLLPWPVGGVETDGMHIRQQLKKRSL